MLDGTKIRPVELPRNGKLLLVEEREKIEFPKSAIETRGLEILAVVAINIDERVGDFLDQRAGGGMVIPCSQDLEIRMQLTFRDDRDEKSRRPSVTFPTIC